MPDKRTHRGPHPDDERLFDAAMVPRLREATHDLCWLLDRGYTTISALKLVGDRNNLEQRQRTAVSRSACSNASRSRRNAHLVSLDRLAGQTLWIDGYNLLTTVEAALAGGVILAARDGCYRDMASMHGTWRKVEETVPAIELIGNFLADCAVHDCVWYLDRPVSNSGRLKGTILNLSAPRKWRWEVELVDDPDPILAAATRPIATADSAILDQSALWVNLAAELTRARLPQAHVINLANGAPRS
jgi:hypothetical protein